LNRLYECALFLAGLAFGSFLNVCISRIPQDESIVRPRSRCPGCKAPIRWYDNIPLLSYFLLLGRCRDCGLRISARYPSVELLTGLAFVACYARFGVTGTTLKFCVFCFLLIGLIFMDAETGLLPREFTYTGIVLGLAFSWFVPVDAGGTSFLLYIYGKDVHNPRWLSPLDSLLGALIGAGFFYLVWALYYLVRKKHGIGFGDVALMGMAGAFLGLKLVVLVMMAAPLCGVLYVTAVLLSETLAPSRRPDADDRPILQREMPFGVFLGGCSLAVVFFGESVWRWYMGLF